MDWALTRPQHNGVRASSPPTRWSPPPSCPNSPMLHSRMTLPGLSSPIGGSRDFDSPQGKTRRVMTFNDKSWIVQSDGTAPIAQLSPQHVHGCKDNVATSAALSVVA